MVLDIFATFLFGGFVTLAVIGHVALVHAMFIRSAQPLPAVKGLHLRLVPTTRRAQLTLEWIEMKAAEPALRIA